MLPQFALGSCTEQPTGTRGLRHVAEHRLYEQDSMDNIVRA